MVNDFFFYSSQVRKYFHNAKIGNSQNSKFRKMCMRLAVRLCRAKSISSHRNVCLELYRCLLRATNRKNLQAALPNPSLSLCLPAIIQKEQRSPLCLVWQQASNTNVLTRQPQNVSTLWSLCLGFNIGKRLRSFKVVKKCVSNYYIDFISFAKWLLALMLNNHVTVYHFG